MTLVSTWRAGSTRPAASVRPADGEAAERALTDVREPDKPVKRKSDQFPCFDGLRAVAALSVLTIHTAFESGFTGSHPTLGQYTARTEFGPEVFFAVSGFLLYRPFVAAAMSRRSTPDKRKFWVRRLRRIVPGYWVALLLTAFVLHANTISQSWYSPFVYLGFGQIYFPKLSLEGLSQAWTLDVEMTFYLLLPLYAALVASRRLTTRRNGGAREPGHQLRVELVGLAVLTIVSFGWRIAILVAGDQPHAHGAILAGSDWLPAYLDTFALGMVLAVMSSYFEVTGRTPRFLLGRALPKVCLGTALAAFFLVAHIGLSRSPLASGSVMQMLGRQSLYGVIAVFLVAPAVFGPQDRGMLRAVLRSRPMIAIGVVSYGFYLWHQSWATMFFRWTGIPILQVNWLALIAFVTALSLLAGTASYWLIERPFIRYRFGPPPARPAPDANMRPARPVLPGGPGETLLPGALA